MASVDRRRLSGILAIVLSLLIIVGIARTAAVAQGDIGTAAQNASFDQTTYYFEPGTTGTVIVTYDVPVNQSNDIIITLSPGGQGVRYTNVVTSDPVNCELFDINGDGSEIYIFSDSAFTAFTCTVTISVSVALGTTAGTTINQNLTNNTTSGQPASASSQIVVGPDLTATENAAATSRADQTATVEAGQTATAAAATATENAAATSRAEQTATVAAGQTATSAAATATELANSNAATQTQAAIDTQGTSDANATATAAAQQTIDAGATQTAQVTPPTTSTPTDVPVETGAVAVTLVTDDGSDIPDDTLVCLDLDCRSLASLASTSALVAAAPSGTVVTFTDVTPGNHLLSVTVEGTLVASQTVPVAAGATTEVTIVVPAAEGTPPNIIINPPGGGSGNPDDPDGDNGGSDDGGSTGGDSGNGGGGSGAAPVTSLPSTGTGDETPTSALIVLMGGILLIVAAVGIALRSRRHA